MKVMKHLLIILILVVSNINAQPKPSAKKAEASGPKTIKGKLLIDFFDLKAPLISASVYLIKSDGSDTSKRILTDKYGDFEITAPSGNLTNYDLNVQPASKEVTNVILANQYGVEIAILKRNGSSFSYKIIQPDIIKLTTLDMNEDIELNFKKFKGSAKNDLIVEELIIYASGKSSIEKQSEAVLDKVVNIMKENPGIRLQITSHTDSRGDDITNLQLSEKRANAVVAYITSKGIDAKLLSTKGMGEKSIRNRCKNKVDCSEKEHEYNRRTEFEFSKN